MNAKGRTHALTRVDVPLLHELAIRNPTLAESRLACTCGWVDKCYTGQVSAAWRWHLDTSTERTDADGLG